MSISKLKLSQKLPIIIVLIGALSAIVTGIQSIRVADEAMFKAEKEKLKALKISRKEAIKNYLSSIDQDLSTFAKNEYVRQALYDFTRGWNELSFNQTERLQALYINDNPHPTGEKDALDYAQDGSSYSEIHKRYHPWFRHFLKQRDYYDIFLFDTRGNLVYTVFKELDYATNLVNGKYKDTDLGNAFRAAMKSTEKGQQHFFDFKPYSPSHGAAASFISEAIFNDNGTVAGVLVFQMPIARINNVMQVSAGMGESGETYLVGEDRLMRSDSRFSEESTILKTKVEGATVDAAFEGKEGVEIVLDYRGIPVVSSYSSVDYHGVKWAILAEIDEEEAFAPIIAMEREIIISIIIQILIVSGISVWIARGISKPISRMTVAMDEIANSKLDSEIEGLDRGDEIGDMARATEIFKKNALEKIRMQKEQDAAKARAEEDKKKMMNQLAGSFEKKVGSIVRSVAAAATQLSHTAQSVSEVVSGAKNKSVSAADSSEQTNQNVQTVASAAEEMSASVSEISQQLTNTNQAVTDSVEKAEAADNTSQQLTEAAERIGNVVELIKGIAEQINLLALNATIESARAGEAGKGFAVVASEVKNLANQAGKAVENITVEIGNMQSVSENVVNTLQQIKEGINNINEYTSNVSAAVEEQSAATKEIASNMSTASAGVTNITSDITSITDATSKAETSTGEVLDASKELSVQAENLSKEVSNFLAEISSDGGDKSSNDSQEVTSIAEAAEEKAGENPEEMKEAG